MNATGTFFSVLLAHFIYHNDKLSYNKTLGCVLGFAGVMLVNFNSGMQDFRFVWNGDGFVVLAAFILSAATMYGKRISQTVDPTVMTGWQLAIGGVVLVVGGYATGGTLEVHSFSAVAILGYLTLLSSVAFAQPLKCRDFGITCSTTTNWVSNMIIGATFLTLLDSIGAAGTFWLYTVLNVAFIGVTFWLIPETKGVTLEHIERKLMAGEKLRNIGV
jgi:drug/metabolite transporter (DMT)-like permease